MNVLLTNIFQITLDRINVLGRTNVAFARKIIINTFDNMYFSYIKLRDSVCREDRGYLHNH